MGCLKLAYYKSVEPDYLRSKTCLTSIKSENNAYRGYLYGFNGQEKDNEVKGQGNEYTTQYRGYDPRTGRPITKDPFFFYSPNQSPYAWAGNSPIVFIDYNGGFRLDPDVAKKYPHLEIVLNAISDLVENSTDEELLKNPIIQNFIGVDGFNKGSATTVLRRIKQILVNGQGPFVSVSEPSEVVNGQLGVTTVGKLENPETGKFKRKPAVAEVDVFINRELLDAVEGVTINSGSKIGLLNGDQVAAMLALYETLLHEAVHVQAKSKGISEGHNKIELGNKFEQALNPFKFLRGNLNTPNSTLTQQQLNRGNDPSNFGFNLNRASVSSFFSKAKKVSSAREKPTKGTQKRIDKNRKRSAPRFE